MGNGNEVVLLLGGLAGVTLSARGARLTVVVFMLELVEVEHYVGLSVQVALEPVQCDSNYVAMAHAMACWNFAYLKPDLVHKTNVLDGEVWSMRPKINAVLMISGPDYF